MNDGIYTSKEIINNVILSISKNIGSNKLKQVNNIYKEWEKILLSIESYVMEEAGQKMLDHSQIIDIKNGIMLIEIDHPGWKQLFETYRNYILKGLKMKIPQLNVDTLTYRLKKGEININEENPVQKKEIVNKTEQDEIKEQIQQKELPTELKKLFDSLKESLEKKQ